MDLLTALRSKSSRTTSWKDVYDMYVSCITEDKGDTKKQNRQKNPTVDWYDKCMNKGIKRKILPKLVKRSGTNLTFEASKISDDYFEHHLPNYLQMIVMSTLYNVTCSSNQDVYISNYDHDTDLVVSYPIEELLMASFYGVQIKGILFSGVLSSKILQKGYEHPVSDPDAVKMMFSKLNYSSIFGLPYDNSVDDDKIEELANQNRRRNIKRSSRYDSLNKKALSESSSDSSVDKIPKQKKTRDVTEIPYYPCCVCRVDVSGHHVETCTETTLDGAHHCFGDCGTDYHREDVQSDVLIHNQMFDFNNFLININQNSNAVYTVTFDQNQNPPYKHASYTDMGRAKVVVGVKTVLKKPLWVTSMRIKVSEKDGKHVFDVKHIGIDWF